MNRLEFLIIFGLILFLTGCARQNSDNEMSAELEKVTDETASLPNENAETPVASTNSDQTATFSQTEQSASSETSQASASAAGNLSTDFKQVTSELSAAKPDAQSIQTALKNAGFYTGKIDGNLGPQTKSAIRNFQAQNSLSVDGKVGSKTWQKLQPYFNSTSNQ